MDRQLSSVSNPAESGTGEHAGERHSGNAGSARRPQIRITLVERKGPVGCHHGHQVGDCFDFDTERGKLCPMAAHVAFPYIDILRYGGEIPGYEKGVAMFACPDVDTLNIFRIERCGE